MFWKKQSSILRDGINVPIGLKSLLFGGHQFLLHPLMLACAWYKLFGFPYDPRLWIAFIVHDWGYYNKKNMDGEEGETHPELGGWIMNYLFGPKWGNFTLLHSKYYARHHDQPCSQLWAADKLATIITPRWIYLPLVKATGEIKEYMDEQISQKYSQEFLNMSQGKGAEGWHQAVVDFMTKQVYNSLESTTPVSKCLDYFLLTRRSYEHSR